VYGRLQRHEKEGRGTRGANGEDTGSRGKTNAHGKKVRGEMIAHTVKVRGEVKRHWRRGYNLGAKSEHVQ
jgi:hypothetical protein